MPRPGPLRDNSLRAHSQCIPALAAWQATGPNGLPPPHHVRRYWSGAHAFGMGEGRTSWHNATLQRQTVSVHGQPAELS